MWNVIAANKRRSVLFIVLLALILIGLGFSIGSAYGALEGGIVGGLAALAVWTIMMIVSLAGGESVLLASAKAREVRKEQAPQLVNIVEEMQVASGLAVTPKVHIIDSALPNAFAVGLNPKRASVAVTKGLMARLNRDELQGVIAHEIGHIANRDTLFMTLAGVTLGSVVIVADLFVRGLFYGGGRMRRSSSREGGGQAQIIMLVVAIAMAILAPLLAQILYFACSRKREYLADATAAQYTRYPEGLASALEKIAGRRRGGGKKKPGHKEQKLEVSRALAPMFIVNPLAARGGRGGLFSTHPPTEERVRVLREMVHGSSFAAYETAYRKVHGGEGMIDARMLDQVEEKGIREADKKAGKKDPAAGWRSANDILHKLEGLLLLSCSCGVDLKVPADSGLESVVCPRCKTRHATADAKPIGGE